MALRIRKEVESEDIKLPAELEHLSFSSIDTFLTCPMRWKFRYVDKIKSPPSIFLEFGGSGHEALKLNNIHKFESGSDLPTKIVNDKFCDTLQTKKKNIEDWDGENPETSYDKHIRLGQKLLAEYMKEVAPIFTPAVMPEQEGNIKISGVPLVYYVDLETHTNIWDYKFVGRAKSDKDVSNSLQMWLYSIARNKSNTNMLSFCKKNGDIVSASAEIGERERTWARYIVQTTARAIVAGHFFPRKPDGQESWQCTPKFCGYYHMCRGGSRRMT